MEVGFSFVSINLKNDVRKLDKKIIFIEKNLFNEQCLINNLLPNYTIIKILMIYLRLSIKSVLLSMSNLLTT